MNPSMIVSIVQPKLTKAKKSLDVLDFPNFSYGPQYSTNKRCNSYMLKMHIDKRNKEFYMM